MASVPEFDVVAAHKYFSTTCFNMSWDLIDKKDRTPEEDEEMIRVNQVSIWHWTQREDCTDKHLSIGFWQSARIYAIIGQAENSRRYGKMSLDRSTSLPPFFVAYAYEALARAEMVAGSNDKMQEYLDKAKKLAADVSDEESRKMIMDDLVTIK